MLLIKIIFIKKLILRLLKLRKFLLIVLIYYILLIFNKYQIRII
jgi:hypothetical protein